jgi:hypothetical protein
VGQKKEFRSSKLESRMGAFLQNSKFELQDSRFFSNPSDHLFPLDLSAVVAPWRDEGGSRRSRCDAARGSITKFLILPMNELISVKIFFVLTSVRIEFSDELFVDLRAVSLKPKRTAFTKDSPVRFWNAVKVSKYEPQNSVKIDK